MPIMDAPQEPKITSPGIMLNSGTRRPIGVMLSLEALTAPQETAVVELLNSVLSPMPHLVSLPTMFWLPARMMWWAASAGFPAASATYMTTAPTTNKMVIDRKIGQDCRRSFTIFPKMKMHATGTLKPRMRIHSAAAALGPANGWPTFVFIDR